MELQGSRETRDMMAGGLQLTQVRRREDLSRLELYGGCIIVDLISRL